MLRVTRNGIDWDLVPDFEPLLDRILTDAGTVIKKTPTKLVTRHDFTGKPIYLKRYLNAVGLRPLKYYFKTTEARNEWGLAEEVIKRGIPVVRHLAFGERWTTFGCQESLIITEGFEGIRLDKFEAKHTDECQVALAKLLRQMHDTGVLQRDLHHNILVKPQPLELCRIDVDRGEMKGPLTEAERIENLAYINVFAPLLDRFFETYRATPEFRQQVLKRSAEIKRELAERRAPRCLDHNLRFEPKQLGGLRWWVRLEFFDDKLRKLLENPDAALERCDRLFKTGPNRQATIGAFGGVVLKRFNQKNKANYIKDIFRPSRAYRAYQKAYHLELLDIPTPRPIAAAERRCCRVVLNSYLVTEEIPVITELDDQIAYRAGQLIGRLHANGFTHGDLKLTNIIWDKAGNVYILDLDGLDYVKEVSPAGAAQDLRRLARGADQSKFVTPAHRGAFLKGYCEERGLKEPPRC